MIHVARYASGLSSPNLLENFQTVMSLGLRWNIYEFGLQRIELTAVSRNQYDQHDRIRDHLGQRIVIFSSELTRPVSGFVSEAEIIGRNQVYYVAAIRRS